MQGTLQSLFIKIPSIQFPGRIKMCGNGEEIPERYLGAKNKDPFMLAQMIGNVIRWIQNLKK